MASRPPKKSKGIDIQYLALLVNHSYQAHDRKLIKGRLSSIEKHPKFPEIPVRPLGYTEALKDKPTTEYTVFENALDTDSRINNFISSTPSSTLTMKEKENIYWRIRLMHGSSVLPFILILVVKELKKLGYTHLTGSTAVDGQVVEEIIDFSDVTTREVYFTPRESNLVRRISMFPCVETFKLIEVSELPNIGKVPHIILVCNDKYALDLTAMQYGMRGRNGELVGRLELLSGYLKRIPGDVFKVSEKNSKEREERHVNGNHNLHPVSIDSTTADVLEHLRKKHVWCFYCGSIVNGTKICGSCKEAKYCGRHCQAADWKGHKKFCKKASSMEES